AEWCFRDSIGRRHNDIGLMRTPLREERDVGENRCGIGPTVPRPPDGCGTMLPPTSGEMSTRGDIACQKSLSKWTLLKPARKSNCLPWFTSMSSAILPLFEPSWKVANTPSHVRNR